MSYFDKPPADIAQLIQYIESEGIQCEYRPSGSFDYIEVSIKDVDDIYVDVEDASINIWSKGAYYVELDRSRYPISLSGIRMANMLIFQFEPSYYED
jgi:hypothetical protein